VAQAAGKDWSAALANMQAATLREDCRPEIASSSETSEGGVSEPPNPDRKGEGSHNRGMSHQANSVSEAKNALRSIVTQGQSVESLKAAAAKGDADAEHELANRYAQGRGVPMDAVAAINWYLQAAAQKHAGSSDRAESMLSQTSVFMQLKEAAEKGNGEAQVSFALVWDEGICVPKIVSEAALWYRKAAEQNIAIAQCKLGHMYAVGRGVAIDPSEAAKWYRKAAEQNNAFAQCELGMMFYLGKGVTRDRVEALKLFTKAAEQNDAMAQCNLGFMYKEGQGVAKDLVEAYKWYYLATQSGSRDAKGILPDVEAALTQDQAARAKRLIDEFKGAR
jgi:TPR repeat protein